MKRVEYNYFKVYDVNLNYGRRYFYETLNSLKFNEGCRSVIGMCSGRKHVDLKKKKMLFLNLILYLQAHIQA